MEEITHVICVEALAHASRHVEAALERAVPHHVWNIVAEQSQGPEPREQHAGRVAFHSALHLRHRPDSAQLAAGWKVLTRRSSVPREKPGPEQEIEECFRDPVPVVQERTASGVTQNQLPSEPAGQWNFGSANGMFLSAVGFLLVEGNHFQGGRWNSTATPSDVKYPTARKGL